MKKERIIISVACIFKDSRGVRWLITKPKDDNDWELPRMVARKTESSARAAIRMAGEQLGMTVKVLEEAGRAGGVTTINEKVIPQRFLYYLVRLRVETGEPVAFAQTKWLAYAQAVRALPQKRDRQMIKAARLEMFKWKKKRKQLQE